MIRGFGPVMTPRRCRAFSERKAFTFAQAFCGTKDIARGKVTGAESLREEFSLGALADAGRAQQNEDIH